MIDDHEIDAVLALLDNERDACALPALKEHTLAARAARVIRAQRGATFYEPEHGTGCRCPKC